MLGGTTVAVSANAGTATAEREEAPPGTSTDQLVNSLLAEGFRAKQVDEPEGDDETADAPGDDDGDGETPEVSAGEEAGEDTDEDETSDGDETTSPTANVERWAAKLLANPKSLSEIPGPDRVTAIEAAFAKKVEEGEANLRESAVQALRFLQQRFDDQFAGAVEAAVADARSFDELDAATEDELGRVLNEDPERMQRYLAYRARRDGKDDAASGKDAPSKPDANAIPDDIFELNAQLKLNPAALKELEAKEKATPGLYAGTPEGLKAFRMDAHRALAKAELSRPDPEADAAEKRRKALADVKDVPRPDGSGGRHAPQELPNDVDALLKMAYREDAGRAKRR